VFSDRVCIDFAGICYVKYGRLAKCIAMEISDGDDKLFEHNLAKLDCQISLFCFTVFTFLNTTG